MVIDRPMTYYVSLSSEKEVIQVKKKKEFAEPELVKHEEKLDEVTMQDVFGSVIE